MNFWAKPADSSNKLASILIFEYVFPQFFATPTEFFVFFSFSDIFYLFLVLYLFFV